MTTYDDVLKANVALHSRLASEYDSCEPHFRSENVSKVDKKVRELCSLTNAKNLLDLGCGTGFIINIAKKYVPNVIGIDITQKMLDQVDLSGTSKIKLICADTGSVQVEAGEFDLVTAYSFLHHLFDFEPTARTAFKALRKGGVFYADLEPNYFFWEEIGKLEREGAYDQIIKREIEMVTFKDEDIQKKFGVSPEVFNQAEYGKSFSLGFKEETIVGQLKRIGFSSVKYFYQWFIGEGNIINNQELSLEARNSQAKAIDDLLQKALPLSKVLYKYVGFVATK